MKDTGRVYAFITCTRVKWEDGEDCPTEEYGWIDRRWSDRVLYESRNDVPPIFEEDLSGINDPEGREELQDEVTDALEWLEGGYEDNGDGTFYAVDSHQPYDEGWDYSYAVHFVRKFYGSNGWAEEPWHPVRDGGFTLKG